MEPVEYKKLGSAGAEGVDYQLSFIFTTLLRAHKLYADKFLIYSEWPLAGCLDDLVLQFRDHQNKDIFRFLQAKHAVDEKKTITYEDLINDDKFKIEKYFDSYKDKLVKEEKFKGKIQDLILFSNLSLNKDVQPYGQEVFAMDAIFHFNQTKKNWKTSEMHKLNSKFIEEYEYRKLREVVKVFLDYCLKGAVMKATNNTFKDCHVILSTEVVNVEDGKFREKFNNAEDLSEGTQNFRKLLLEKLKLKDNTYSSVESQKAWMRGVSLKFANGFGATTNNNVGQFWPIMIMTSEDKRSFKEFCNLFILATSQPNDKQLTSLLKSECEGHCRQSLEQFAAEHLQIEIRNWFKTPKVFPLNFMFVEKAMNYIKNNEEEIKLNNQTERNIQKLSPTFKFEFDQIPYEKDLKVFLESGENVFRLISNGSMKVSLLKLFNCLDKLPHQNKYHFWTESQKSQSNDFFEAYRNSAVFNLLICEMRNNMDDKHLEKRLEQMIQDKNCKKVIFIYNQEVTSGKHQSFHDQTFFEDLTEDTQIALSESKISFQGADVPFNSIYGKEFPPKHQDIDSWGILLDKQFKMNGTFVRFDSSYYVNRTLTAELPYFNKDTIQQKLGDQHIVTYKWDDFNEQIKQHPTKHVHLLYELDGFWCVARSNWNIKEVSKYKAGTHQFQFNDDDGDILHKIESVFVISDMAGYGKTTTTSYLANELPRHHPNCWVARLQPSHLDFDADNIEADFKMNDEFLMENLFKLTSPLERFIFKQYLEDEQSRSQLFFIFDGFDEIDEDYQKVIIEAVKYLKTKRNVKFIGIGTRPHHQEQFEEELQSVTFQLLSFNHENKITFLEKFWLSRGVKGQSEQLRDYSERLIEVISQSISYKESELTGIPLQMRMIGEIYKDNAIKCLAGKLRENEIVAVDLFGLYEQFIKKKEDVYFNDKLGVIQSSKARKSILGPLRKNHIIFALKLILGGDYGDLKDQVEDSIGFGIIEENQGGFSFIHRTFAEFLTAKYILDYTLPLSATFYIDKLMQVMHQKNCGVVRKFINSKLDYRKMASALTKPEYEEAIQKIQHKQFQEAITTSVWEKTFEVFRFQLEFYSYWYPEEMKEVLFRENEDLLESLPRKNIPLYIDYMTQVWMTSEHNASELLLEMFKGLITNIFRKRWSQYVTTAKMVTDLQDELEEKQILSEDRLKSILFETSFKEWGRMLCHKKTIGYLKHLKIKQEQLFYSFLREKNKFVVSEYRNDEFYELLGETCDPFWVFSTFVVSLLTGFDWHWQYKIVLKSYLPFISKYIRQFDHPKLEEFKTYLLEYIQVYGWYYSDVVKSQARALLEFLRNHPDIISLGEFMQTIKIHKNLSFIENCALWGWKKDLEFILNAGDIEVELVARLQLEGSESLDEKIECILNSIRVHNTDEQLMEIARVNHQYRVTYFGTLDVTIISKAIFQKVELRKEIYSSWMKSDELFDAFMTGTLVTNKSIKFVMKKFPQHKMRYFEINKNCFVGASQDPIRRFPSILEDDPDILNKEEFLKLNQLQNDDGETILFNICNRWNRKEIINYNRRLHPLVLWLQLMKRECSLDDIVRIFRTTNPKGETVFQILNKKCIYSGKKHINEQINCKSILFTFFKKMNLLGLKKNIDIREADVQYHQWSDVFWEEEEGQSYTLGSLFMQ